MPINVNNRTVSPRVNSDAAQSYTIKSGDSLSKIARNFDTTLDALVSANKGRYPSLEENPGMIRVGWTLTIPGTGDVGGGGDNGGGGVDGRTSNDDIQLVGMNEGSTHEANQLKQTGRRQGFEVQYVGDYRDDEIRARDNDGNMRNFDLTSADGVAGFVKTLGLPPEQSEKIGDAIRNAGGDARDEMAQIAQHWAVAEKGGQIPSRQVLSGHSVGDGVWGDDNGTIYYDSLGELAAAMPEAARSVEDLHIAGCYSGGEQAVGVLEGIFPKVQTMWFYEGSAPGSHSGAVTHEKIWEEATRGDNTDLRAALAKVKNYRKGKNVAVWSTSHGYIGNERESLATLESRYESRSRGYDDYFEGRRSLPPNTQHGPLRDFYNTLQALRQHPELPEERKDEIDDQRDQTIRLIYYAKTVAPKFAEHHRDALSKGFDAVGMTAPDFGSLRRGEALEVIGQFEDKLNDAGSPPAESQWALKLLTEGLRDLDPKFIPDRWV